MSTRSSSFKLVAPFSNPESVIRNHRRNRVEASLLLDFEEINMNPNNNLGPPSVGPIPQNHPNGPPGPIPQNRDDGPPRPNLQAHVLDLRTMEELCQPTMNGQGALIAAVNIQAMDFGLKNHIIQQIAEMNKNFLRMSQSNQQVNVVNPSCETCGGPHHYYERQAAGGFTQGDVYAATGNYNAGGNSYQPQGSPQTNASSSDELLRQHIIASDAKFQLLANQMIKMENAFNERPQGGLPSNTVPNPREETKVIITRSGITLAGPSVPPPPLSSSSKEVERDPETTIDKLPEKLRDPGKFPIPCDFSELEECMALADIGASINLMPLSVWKKLMLPELVPTRMTLELANRSVSYPAGIAEDVFMQVGKFTFPVDFVVIDYDVDPRVPLILGIPFLRTVQTLVDVQGEELTLRVSDGKLIFNVESISKYPHKHGDESINQPDIIDTTCQDHFHELLNVQKSIHPLSGSPTPSSDPVIASLSPSVTPFGDSNFLLEEIDVLLALDDSIPPEIDKGIFDPEGHILLFKKLLNNDSTKDPPPKELKNDEIKTTKSSIVDPPELELKDLPPHLEHAF
ncbi:reverse transcriptase domain-containing protein [Tanacetum coccineum]